MYLPRRFSNCCGVLALSLLLLGLQQIGTAGYIGAKAHLAQWLIGQSWERSLGASGQAQRPWPWADTWPVARLKVPQLSVNLFVLRGASGNALAFGPGLDIASAGFGEPGLTVVGGHRDTHFAFLEEVEEGTTFSLQLPTGEQITYRVEELRIVDVHLGSLPMEQNNHDELILVTCYPFDAVLPGGPLRYVVRASQVSTSVAVDIS